MRYWLISLFLIVFVVPLRSQILGIPNIRNYPKSEYNAGTQNWAIAQDQDGFMYFANNDGLLRFDGFHWDLIPVPLSLVRSVHIDSDNRIYVALLYDFGEVVRDQSGHFHYRSFLPLVPEEERDFNDVWCIQEWNGEVVFQSYEKMFFVDREKNKVNLVLPEHKFHFSFSVNGQLWYQDVNVGLFEWTGSQGRRLEWADPIVDQDILTILPLDGKALLIGTLQGGLFYYDGKKLKKWDTPVGEFVDKFKLFCGTTLGDSRLALGTIRNGLVIANLDGKILQVINRSNELQNNTVLSVFADRDHNLWLGLDNGISYLESNSPLTYLTAQGRLGTGYCAKLYKGSLYLGTNQGLFVLPFAQENNSSDDYRLVENTEGQVWSLTVHKGQLICGHNNGTFVVKGNRAEQIINEPGAWDYIPVKDRDDLIVGGHYQGLVVLKWLQNRWVFSHRVKGFDESSRFLRQDEQGDFWVSHGGKGVFRLRLNSEMDSVVQVRRYGKADGLPSDMHNVLMVVKGIQYVSTIDGLFRYNRQQDRFGRDSEITQLFGLQDRLMKVQEDDEGNLWFLGQSSVGVLRQNEDLSYTKITSPFDPLREQLVSEFQFVYPLNRNRAIFGIDRGFAMYDAGFRKSSINKFRCFISKVELAYLDSVIYPGSVPTEDYIFPFARNSIRFHYNSPFYENLKGLRFSYQLQNFSDEWSPWSADIYKEFTNLPYGEYVFRVRAKNNYGIISTPGVFRFTILPPWYHTKLAHFIYALLAGLVLILIAVLMRYRVQRLEDEARKKHEKEMRDKEEQFKHQALIAEKEIIKLRNDKLRAEMVFRDKELANQTNNLIQKNRLLQKIMQELHNIQSTTQDGVVKSKMAILKKRIEKELDDKNQNKIFETYFDEVHKEFFERLKAKYPQLSPKDLRLCAYIRMNISTKEIATLLNISYRGAEISRYRLRKKLDLPREVNLAAFLSGI